MRPIDADALLKHKTDHDMISTHLIFNAPTIEAEPVRRGKWIVKAYPWDACSLCGTYVNGYDCWRYCPYCGAKMEGER